MPNGAEINMQYIWAKTRAQSKGQFSPEWARKSPLQQSQVDPCLYFCPGKIFLVYIDDCLLSSPMDDLIDQGIKDLHSAEPPF